MRTKELWQSTAEELLEERKSSPTGLSATEAADRLRHFGPNELQEGGKKSTLRIFFEQFLDFLVIILIIAAVVSAVLGDIESMAVIIAVIMYIFLFRTRKGLALRSVGENPAAADTVGINVTKYRYLATVIGGGICGLGGMYIAMVQQNGNWVDDCVSGYGWLAVALVIFAAWKSQRALWVALLFGGLKIARFYVSLPIADQLYDMLPYIVTIIILIITSIRGSKENSQPKSCGYNYFREER